MVNILSEKITNPENKSSEQERNSSNGLCLFVSIFVYYTMCIHVSVFVFLHVGVCMYLFSLSISSSSELICMSF